MCVVNKKSHYNTFHGFFFSRLFQPAENPSEALNVTDATARYKRYRGMRLVQVEKESSGQGDSCAVFGRGMLSHKLYIVQSGAVDVYSTTDDAVEEIQV